MRALVDEAVELTIASRCRYGPGWEVAVAPGWCDDFSLWLITRGRGGMAGDDGETVLAPGTCVLLRPWRGYRFWNGSGTMEGLNVHFTFRPSGAQAWRARAQDLPPEILHVPELHRCAQRFGDAIGLWRSGAAARRAEAAHMVHALLWHLAAPPPERLAAGAGGEVAARIATLLERIRAEPERHWTVAGLAAAAGCSADHFSRSFRALTGMTPRLYALSARMDRARELLRASDLPVAAVAERLGYGDVFLFSRHFKEIAGVPPSAYRRML